jgi:hypothetical protein
MGQREEETVTAFLDAQFEGDFDRALNYLVKDADYRVPAWKEFMHAMARVVSTHSTQATSTELWQSSVQQARTRIQALAVLYPAKLSEHITGSAEGRSRTGSAQW